MSCCTYTYIHIHSYSATESFFPRPIC